MIPGNYTPPRSLLTDPPVQNLGASHAHEPVW
jgi:hypothetical protein